MQNPRLPSDTRLAPFLGLAALLHAVVILVVPLRMGHPLSAPALQLALARPETAPSAAAHPAAHAPTPAATEVPRPLTAAGAGTEPLPASAALPSSDAARTAATAGEESARVIAQVRAALARYFVYPLAARRQGWEGEVLIGFSVSRDGHIDHVEVVRSSGYGLLDEAARASLSRVGNLPDFAAREGEPLQLRMPVVYRLES